MEKRCRFRLPPGFRFHPTDEELVMYYLKRKVMGKKIRRLAAISEVDIYNYAPWELPQSPCSETGVLKRYFFCATNRKYGSGGRMKRSTGLGFWKTTGDDKLVRYNNEVVGRRKSLVFHRGKAPKGDRTDWVMHEYWLEDKRLAGEEIGQDKYVLCVIFEKEGVGPKNGAQYGAPFKEEDWEDDDDEEEEEEGEEQEVIVEGRSGREAALPVPTVLSAPIFTQPSDRSVSEVLEGRNDSEFANSRAGFSGPGFVVSSNPSSSEVVEGRNGSEVATSSDLCESIFARPSKRKFSEVVGEGNGSEVANSTVLSANLGTSGDLTVPVFQLQSKQCNSGITQAPLNMHYSPNVSCPSETPPGAYVPVPTLSDNNGTSAEPPSIAHDDDFNAMLDGFFEEGEFIGNGYVNNENQLGRNGTAEANHYSGGNDIFNGLGDLGNPPWFNNGNEGYFELKDLAD